MKKPTVFLSLRGRNAAVAIFKPKAWHPGTKPGRNGVRQKGSPVVSGQEHASTKKHTNFLKEYKKEA